MGETDGGGETVDEEDEAESEYEREDDGGEVA